MNILVCGVRQTGKSTLALYIAKQWGGTVVIWDPRGSFAAAGFQCHSVEQLLDYLESGDYIVEVKGKRVPYPLVYHVDGDPEESFNELCAALFPPMFTKWKGKVALIIDEAANLQSPHQINPALNRLVGQAPIHDILVVQTAHELTEWHSKGKSVMDELYMFYQIGPKNYQRMVDLCGEEVAETVQGFEPKSKGDPRLHHCVRYSFKEILTADGKRWEVWDEPEVWFADLGQQNRLPGNRQADEKAKGLYKPDA
jgi:hypothetical protein